MTGSETEMTATPYQADPAPVGRFALGQVIAGRFAVVRYIARGGMGEVYEVEDRFLQKTHVALKVIAPEIAGDISSSHRFEQEVLLARRTVHPNLCPIYDIARCDDPAPPFLFLTMKLLAGETLSARLRRTGLIPREEAILIFRQLVAGLAAIHAAGIIHRDIKPNNVMLDSSGQELCVYIMDFGLARLHEADRTIATQTLMAGTPGYMAPEILRGQGPSQAADLFALGVLLHEVLAGEQPRFGPISLSAEPTPKLEKADVPPVFLHAVKELLSSEPDRRCAAFEQLKADLSISSVGGPRTAEKGFRSLGFEWVSRRQFAAGSAAAAASAVAGGVVWKWDRFYDMLHPLPAKRFVALMEWPSGPPETAALVSEIIGSIHSRLIRAEAQVPNLLLIFSGDVPTDAASSITPNGSVSAWGANLVMAASLEAAPASVTVYLRVLEAESMRLLRSARFSCSRAELNSLADKGGASAAKLLGLPMHEPNVGERDELRGLSSTAFASFSDAEQLAIQPNNIGLNAAILKYSECLNEAPHFSLGYAKLAIAYSRKYLLFRDTAILNLARRNSEKATEANPKSAMALYSRGLVSLYAGETELALDYFATALRSDPGNPDILLYRAQAFRDLNKLPAAEQAYHDILKERPNYWPANNELGWILFRQAKYQAAADAFDAAAMAAPNVALPLANLGTMYVAMDKHDEAIDASERSNKRSPNVTAFENLGDLAFVDKNYKGALAYYQEAAKIEPTRHMVWRDIGDCYYMMGQPAQVKQSYAKAATLLSDALKDNSRSGASWMTLAFYHAKTEDQASARADIKNAEARGATDVHAQFMKVQVFAVLGMTEEATLLLLTCIDRGLSPVEVDLAVDLNQIRNDPRYLARVSQKIQSPGH